MLRALCSLCEKVRKKLLARSSEVLQSCWA